MLDKYKTSCCKASWYVKRRADFRCQKCDTDVTMEILLLYNLEKKENDKALEK